MSDRPRILIVGGGIAGLALARALRQRGFSAEIVERAATWEHAGSGLFVPANGVRALGVLGLGASVLARACVIPRQRVMDHRGRLLLDIGLDEIWGTTGPCIGLPREALHEILREGLDSWIRLGTTVEALDDGAAAVGVRLTDGSTGKYDLVVGADGIHSSIRRFVAPEARPRAVGQVSWRFVVDAEPGITSWTAMLARGRAFLMVPIGDGRLYCYSDVGATNGDDPTHGSTQGLVELFGDFAAPVAGILRRLSSTTAPYFSPIEEVTADPWVKGRIVLIGDAAHATSPNMAQGASMALEDALVLAELLAAGPSSGSALAAFVARRSARVRWVQQQTHRRDRTRSLAPAIRNGTLRLFGKRIFKANNRPLVQPP